MIDVKDARVGFMVFYQKPHMKWPEYGQITNIRLSIIERPIVHVLFTEDALNGGDTPKACYCEDLYWPPDYCAKDGVNAEGQLFQRISR